MNTQPKRLALLCILALAAAWSIHAADKQLPKLLELGATSCTACKKMAPIVEKLKEDYAGVLDVEFVDVMKNPAEAKKHEIRLIPTQILFDEKGKELFRHVGFFSREAILAKWRELGYELKPIAPETKKDAKK